MSEPRRGLGIFGEVRAMGNYHPTDNCECMSDDNWWAAVLQEAEVADVRYVPAAGRAGSGTPQGGDDWELAHRLCASEEAIELEVVGYNRGGLLVNLNSLRGFVPASHLVRFAAEGPL